MSDKICHGSNCSGSGGPEAVCIHTTKVYDQCKSKECIRNLRVFLPNDDQCFIDSSNVTVKAREAELLHASMDVEKIAFNRGFYTIDIRFFYKITVEACNGGRPRILEGLSVFDKRCILFGSEGGAHIFTSKCSKCALDGHLQNRSNLPTAVVEVVDPIILDARVVFPSSDCCATVCCNNNGCSCCNCSTELREVPQAICGCFQGQELSLDSSGNQLIVTLGQFSIIKLERDIQLLMPACDICIPEKDCNTSCAGAGDARQDPCAVFSTFAFPVDEFFPPRCQPCPERTISSCCHETDASTRSIFTSSCDCGHSHNDSCGCGTASSAQSNRSSNCGSGCNTCGSGRAGSGRCGC